jgi:hypothetical protein
MEYKVEFMGNVYNLPKYSLDIADKLEKVNQGNRSNVDFKTKCKNMYNICMDLLDPGTLNDIIGSLKECDPNSLNILYLKICQAYNEPLETYNTDGLQDLMNNPQFTKLLELGKLAEKAKLLK